MGSNDNVDDTMIQKFEELTNQISRLSEISEKLINKDSSSQVIIHKTEGVTHWGVAAIIACFCTWIFLVIFTVVMVAELHDLRAWSDISKNDIATIKGKMK